MTDLLKRNFAPITDEAWAEIDRTAVQTIKANLSARTVVDFQGPLGWQKAAVNLGRVQVPDNASTDGVNWGIRQVLPLIEVRIPFTLNMWEIDNISRGAADPDLEALELAVLQATMFEENAIYNGFSGAGIKGMIEMASHPAITLGESPEQYPTAVGEAVKALKLAGVGGPYALVLGNQPYHALYETLKSGFYPPHRVLQELLQGGDILRSPALSGGVVFSTRGGDFELTIGQDLSIGYHSHDKQSVDLFITESFTFRVLEGDAVAVLK